MVNLPTNRKCRECAACCWWPAIPGFKNSHTPCAKLKPCGVGRCGIHASPEKPDVCSTYSCMWLDGHFKADDRPDLIGVCFTPQVLEGGQTLLTAHEVTLGASKIGRAAALIETLSQGIPVVIIPADNSTPRLVHKQQAERIDLRLLLTQAGIRIL